LEIWEEESDRKKGYREAFGKCWGWEASNGEEFEGMISQAWSKFVNRENYNYLEDVKWMINRKSLSSAAQGYITWRG